MYQFELGLIHYINELHKEREAKAAKKAEQSRSNEAETFMRNSSEIKAQNSNQRGSNQR